MSSTLSFVCLLANLSVCKKIEITFCVFLQFNSSFYIKYTVYILLPLDNVEGALKICHPDSKLHIYDRNKGKIAVHNIFYLVLPSDCLVQITNPQYSHFFLYFVSIFF